MINRATREGKESAIHRLEELAKEVIPMNTPILDALAENKIKPFIEHPGQVRFDPDPKDLSKAGAWMEALPPELRIDILGFLNRLEAWCVYFTTGVADNEVAFTPVAPLLRAWVGQYYPVLVLMRADGRSGNFGNVVRLYRAWSDRMDEQQLARLHEDLVAQLDRKRSIMAKSSLPGIIGADVDD
jgi:hypothetical protein